MCLFASATTTMLEEKVNNDKYFDMGGVHAKKPF
jgi:hypothetical protein